ncbi:MAG: rhodanese-like domain-containing protein [Thiogranum sp.]|nr:rhodanese-like domain-containing protein [Thiogranum sp.]
MRTTLVLIMLCGAALAIAADYLSPALTPQQVSEKLAADPALQVVDVRKPVEFAVGHIPGAVNMPIDELDLRVDELGGDREVLVYCINGARTRRAEHVLLDNGIENIYHLQGAFQAWIQAGLPIEKGAAR